MHCILQITDNGVISLQQRFLFHRTPQPLPLTENFKIIAPFWADVDRRRSGQMYHRQITNETLLSRATREIRGAFPMYQNLTIDNMLIVTWSDVAHFTSPYVTIVDKVRFYCTKDYLSL